MPEIVGNYAPAGVFALEYNRLAPPGTDPIAQKWYRSLKSHKTAPMLEDLDQGDQKLEVILAGNEADQYLYVWTAEGVTFRDPAHGSNGRFTRIYDSQAWSYQSLSAGDVSSTYAGLEILQALPNGKVVGYRTDQWSPSSPLTCLVSLECMTKSLSTPLLGDVGRRRPERDRHDPHGKRGRGGPGAIWILGPNGSTEDWIAPEAPPFRFTFEPARSRGPGRPRRQRRSGYRGRRRTPRGSGPGRAGGGSVGHEPAPAPRAGRGSDP